MAASMAICCTASPFAFWTVTVSGEGAICTRRSPAFSDWLRASRKLRMPAVGIGIREPSSGSGVALPDSTRKYGDAHRAGTDGSDLDFGRAPGDLLTRRAAPGVAEES